MKKTNGITLIALVVTIIVLIILSGVTLNLVFSENGIIQKAKTTKIEQTKAQILESLELAKSQVIFEGEGNTELEKYLNYIDGKKLNGFEVTSVEKTDEVNAIIWVEWQYKYKAAQVGTDVIINADGYVSEVDMEKPNNAEITIAGNTTQTSLPITLTAKIVQTDADSGINIAACKYILNQSSEELGTDSSKYSEEKFNSDDETITLNFTEIGDWYLHVLSVDNVGKSIETIKGPITISENLHKHVDANGIVQEESYQASSAGGCFTKGVYSEGYVSCTGQYTGWYAWYDNSCSQNHRVFKYSCGHNVDHNLSLGQSGNPPYYTCTKMIYSSTANLDYYTYGCEKTEQTIEGYIVSYQ